ncbi:type IV toxin-antitoxin system AbiEi family antitoxin [candidate division KSB1 bacterium]|nr:type IV toxin-antitoxin system AbiEi family antitoxin [candidate division KSB1 bacterium]
MEYNYLETYISRLQEQGRYAFTFDDIANQFPKDEAALRMALIRLRDKKRVERIRKGFYIIVPVEYRGTGVLPASSFINEFMNHLQRDYYVGLLSAAALHGAAHQQPQLFQVIIHPPSLRPIQIKGLKIQFIMKRNFPSSGISQQKTDTGFMKASSPELTALDIIQFQHQCGGFSRLVEILEELSEKFDTSELKQALKNKWPNVVLQRFGYLCEHTLNRGDYIQPVRSKLNSLKIHPERLVPGEPSRAGAIDKTWSIIQNVQPESVY